MILIDTPSPNFDTRPDGLEIDMLILHYTGMKTGAEAIDRLCDPEAEVSAHYLVEEDGRIFKLVDEDKRAWHAGVSFWRGATNINARSIGIEIVNPGHEWGYRPFPAQQIKSVLELCKDILSRYRIAPRNVVGHSDVAPLRKTDPGELFPWADFAKAGVGLWTEKKTDPKRDVNALLCEFGYDMTEPGAALEAFRRHYLPEELGKSDVSESCRVLASLLDLGGQNT